MISATAEQLLNQIDSTVADVTKVSGSKLVIDSFLAQFLVVYVCGIYEEVFETILVEFVDRYSSHPSVTEYVRNTIDKSFRNPDSDKVISLLKSLGNVTWADTIKNMTNERIALDSIVNNKNNIAHGRGSIITLTDVVQYYQASRPLIEKFDSLLA